MQVDRQSVAQQPAPLTIHHMSWKMRIFLVLLAILIGTCVFAATMVAKTGIVRVPVLSSIVSSTGEPSRIVAIPPATPTVQETFKTQFEGAVARYARSRTEADREIQVRVAESSITKSLLAELPNLQGKFGDAKVEYAQVAVDTDALELFVKLSRGDHDNTLRIRFTTPITDGRPSFKVHEVKLGTLGIPSFAINMITNALGEQGMDDIVAGLSSVMQLREVELRRGMMLVHGTLSTSVANGR